MLPFARASQQFLRANDLLCSREQDSAEHVGQEKLRSIRVGVYGVVAKDIVGSSSSRRVQQNELNK